MPRYDAINTGFCHAAALFRASMLAADFAALRARIGFGLKVNRLPE